MKSSTFFQFPFLLTIVLSIVFCQNALAEKSPWQTNNRIAISADGNPDADPDDIGATPMTIAVLAKAGLYKNLVHYDFNNWLEYKKIPSEKNEMWKGAMGAQARWGFNSSHFFDASITPDDAINNLAKEISKSSVSDPLYLIVAGPMELIYQAMLKADKNALSFVKLITHSGYNDYVKPRLWQHNLDDVIQLNKNIEILRLPDQNRFLRTEPNYQPWRWLRDHVDPNLKWLYSRLEAGLADVSDTGMLTWLIGVSGDDFWTTIPELSTFFGSQPIAILSGSHNNVGTPPTGVAPEVKLPVTQHIFEEVGGRLVIEAESVPLTGSWVIENSEPNFSGSGYIRYMPENIEEQHYKARGVLTYKLRISTPGQYRMAFKHSHKGAKKNQWGYTWTLMGIDIAPFGNFRKTFHSIDEEAFKNETGFTFNTSHDNYGIIAKQGERYTEPLYYLDAGDHYFFIAGRSGGYRLDKIHFFKQGTKGFKSDSIAPTPIIIK